MVEELLSLMEEDFIAFREQKFDKTAPKFLYIYNLMSFADHKHTILYAEDDLDDLFMIRQAFEQFDGSTQLVHASNGFEALEQLNEAKAERNLPCLIILDINMPGMNGWEFLEEYNKLDEKSKSRAIVVMLTTSDNPDDKQKSAMMNIASDFRTKPLTGEMLEEIVNKYFK